MSYLHDLNAIEYKAMIDLAPQYLSYASHDISLFAVVETTSDCGGIGICIVIILQSIAI
jgi:hypothetical protein